MFTTTAFNPRLGFSQNTEKDRGFVYSIIVLYSSTSSSTKKYCVVCNSAFVVGPDASAEEASQSLQLLSFLLQRVLATPRLGGHGKCLCYDHSVCPVGVAICSRSALGQPETQSSQDRGSGKPQRTPRLFSRVF